MQCTGDCGDPPRSKFAFHGFHAIVFTHTLPGFVCALGDVIAQTLIEKRQWRSYNVQRTATMGAIGFMFTVGIDIIDYRT